MAQQARYLEVQALAKKALEAGCKVQQLTSMEWDISADCEAPYVHTSRGVPEIGPQGDQRVRLGGDRAPIDVHVRTRCHRCPACLKARYWLWRLRAAAELAKASRTWFGTLTLNPHAHFLCRCRAFERLKKRGTNFDELSPDEQFVERHLQIAAELTKWLKRLREASPVQLRYLLVAEAHRSGLPHYHILLHEAAGALRKRDLHASWPHGFTSWKLAEDPGRTSAYVTKYLLKDARARLRASVRYGLILDEHHTCPDGKVSETNVGKDLRPHD